MTITSIEAAVRRIAANILGVTHDLVHDLTEITDSLHLTALNEEACLAMNVNISHEESLAARTVGEYIALVRSKR